MKNNLNRFEKLRNHISELEGRLLSAREFARILGVANNTISKTENEELPPSPKVATRLEEKYGISREWYLTGEGEAPWEKKEYEDYFKDLDEMERAAEEENIPPTLEKGLSCFVAGKRIYKTPEKNLVHYFVEAGKNPTFRSYIYNVLYNILEGCCDEHLSGDRIHICFFPKTPVPAPGEIKKKPGELIYKSLEFALDIPTMLNGLSSKERKRWTRNVGVLERWVILMPRKALMVPPWAYIRFCREVELDHGSGKLDKVTDVLRNIIKEGKK